ncbi:hypothetical protein TPA0906_08130 [Streptomyces olivaceus]|nr:hypothetical protein TPA0906_08130 [Streptomyces olivaceus]
MRTSRTRSATAPARASAASSTTATNTTVVVSTGPSSSARGARLLQRMPARGGGKTGGRVLSSLWPTRSGRAA